MAVGDLVSNNGKAAVAISQSVPPADAVALVGPTGEKVTSDGSGNLAVADQTIHAGERRPTSLTTSYISTAGGWSITPVPATAATAISSDGAPVVIGGVRVGGTAALGGAATIAGGTIASNVVYETIPSSSAVGLERGYFGGVEFPAGCVVTVATSGTLLVFWRNL